MAPAKPIIHRLRDWELHLARDSVEPSKFGLWMQHHGATPRRSVRTFFSLLGVLAFVALPIMADLKMPVPSPPWAIVRMTLTHCGALLTCVTFLVLFWMRGSAWPGTATGLVAFFAMSWYMTDALCLPEKLSVWDACALGRDGWESGVFAMLFCLLFGACDRMAVLIERERAKQRAKNEQ